MYFSLKSKTAVSSYYIILMNFRSVLVRLVWLHNNHSLEQEYFPIYE